ncbi:MAG: hypothetical protein IJR22_02660 [Acidaminococcaceae bacterium]|nr:hypothetical protein [Acidaminococcaceae bacterium]
MFTDFETYKNYETVLTTIGDSSHENNSIEIDYDDRFVQLPEAYDIFQNINLDKETSVNSNQKRFAKNCLDYMEKVLKRRFIETRITKVLPKLYMVVEEDNALTIHWDYINYRIYLDIEREISQSFYGLIAKNAQNGYGTSTGQLNEKNYQEVLENIINFVFLN